MNPRQLIEVYGRETILCDLEDYAVDNSCSRLARVLKYFGYDQSARQTINDLKLWNKSIVYLVEFLESQMDARYYDACGIDLP